MKLVRTHPAPDVVLLKPAWPPAFHATPTLTNTTLLFSIYTMNSKQMKKWLEQQGASFQPGKGSHLKVFLNGKQSTLPMHGTAELG
ncbi:MAG: type II toxin-antitoxin system HicA family toxin, partial [Polaromonas sp.]|nr:type II toxin-antitoxin system HicA family toxin [Polaromonas sp.]